METQCVYCEVEAESVQIIATAVRAIVYDGA